MRETIAYLYTEGNNLIKRGKMYNSGKRRILGVIPMNTAERKWAYCVTNIVLNILCVFIDLIQQTFVVAIMIIINLQMKRNR